MPPRPPYVDELTLVIRGWSERSYELLMLFTLGLKNEPDRVTGLMLGELNNHHRINKVVYRFAGQANRDTNGLYLFGRSNAETALFFAPDLGLDHGGTSSMFGQMILAELGILTDAVTTVVHAINGRKCEMSFNLRGGEWHGSYKLLVTV